MTPKHSTSGAKYTKGPWTIYKCNDGKSSVVFYEHNRIVECPTIEEAMSIVKAINNHNKLVEALNDCICVLQIYIEGGNPNSLYKDGKHNCYVMGSKETLIKAKQALSQTNAQQQEKKNETAQTTMGM